VQRVEGSLFAPDEGICPGALLSSRITSLPAVAGHVPALRLLPALYNWRAHGIPENPECHRAFRAATTRAAA
jgi:hypothetical protein